MDETDADEGMGRRGFLATAAGTAAIAGASGTAVAQEGTSSGGSSGGETVAVGAGSGLSFDPAELTVAPETTVTWQWTGNGGAHNVVADDGAFDSGEPVASASTTFTHTFAETGEFPYHCAPHESAGMVGTITVQEGGAASGGGGGGLTVPDSAKNLGIAAMSFMLSTLGLAYFFIRYGGDYENTER